MGWTDITNRDKLFETVHKTVKEDYPFQKGNDLTNGPRYAIPFMLRKTLNKLPAQAKDLMLSLITSQDIVDSAPARVRGVKEGNNGWTIVDASKRFTTLVAPPNSTMANRLAQVVAACLNPAVEPIGYEEYTTGGTGCNMERAIYDYINNRAYYSPSHYEPFDATSNTIQAKSTAAGLISPFFGINATFTGL